MCLSPLHRDHEALVYKYRKCIWFRQSLPLSPDLRRAREARTRYLLAIVSNTRRGGIRTLQFVASEHLERLSRL